MTRSARYYSDSDDPYDSYDSYDSTASDSSFDEKVEKLKRMAQIQALKKAQQTVVNVKTTSQPRHAIQNQPVAPQPQPIYTVPPPTTTKRSNIIHHASDLTYDQIWDYTQEFFGRVNDRVTDRHRSYFGRDSVVKVVHVLWLSMWGIITGVVAAGIYIYPQMLTTILDISTYGYFLFTALEYALILRSLKTAHYQRRVEVPDPPVLVEKGKVCLMLAFGWNTIGLTDEQKVKTRDSRLAAISDSLAAAGAAFHPDDIYLVHNTNDVKFDEEGHRTHSAVPDEDVQNFIRGKAIYAGLEVASKSVAVYFAAHLVERLGYQYTIVMDDDCMIPIELTEVLNKDVDEDAYCFAITAFSETSSAVPRLLTNHQAIEYALSDLGKISQANFTAEASVLSPHGAANMWRAELLPEIMAYHNAIFDGEDYQMGKILRERHKEGRMAMISGCHVPTNVPTAIRALTRQRKNSWDLASHQFLCGGVCGSPHTAEYLHVLLCFPWSIANMMLRLYTAQDVWTAMQDYIRVPLLLWYVWKAIFDSVTSESLMLNPWVVTSFALMFIVQWVVAFAFQYIKVRDRPELQITGSPPMKIITCLTFPFYRFYLSFVRVASLFTYVVSYQSIKRTAVPIRDTGLQHTLPAPFTIDDVGRKPMVSPARLRNAQETMNDQ